MRSRLAHAIANRTHQHYSTIISKYHIDLWPLILPTIHHLLLLFLLRPFHISLLSPLLFYPLNPYKTTASAFSTPPLQWWLLSPTRRMPQQ